MRPIRTRRPQTRHLLAATAFALAASTAGAEPVQGELGNDSTGTFDVSIEKRFAVRISGLEDVDFGDHSAVATNGPFVERSGFCVYSTTGRFNLTVTSANAVGTSLAMANTSAGDGSTPATPMLYTMTLDGAATPVASGVLQPALTGDPAREDCGGTDNVTVDLEVSQVAFTAAAPGIYSDTLTLFVEPL